MVTAFATAAFCTGSISLRINGTSALYVTPGYAVPTVPPAGGVVTTRIPYRPIAAWMEG